MPCPNSHRKRTISKAFRCSPEEGHRIELLAKAAGVTQQDYIMAKIEDKEFTIVPDVRTFKILRDEMRAVVGELSRLRNTGESESTPIPLTPFTPPSGGLSHRANWPLRTRPG